MSEQNNEIEWVAAFQERTGRLTYRATLCHYTYGGLENIPQNAVQFAEWLNDMLVLIPEEHRDRAVLILADYSCDECSSERAKFWLYVDRPETDEEYSARMQADQEKRERDAHKSAVNAARKAKEKEEHDRAEFERLKKKYGE